ncbi:MAG: suppressor of fused domain protein [Ruminococcaceae bacterium]|nr:suppressor of fused domain protein [Oscillospiraceae bacterium]
MNTIPVFYTEKQMDEIQKFISDNLGGDEGCIAHETESEYVHTDVNIAKGGCVTYCTFGMGARIQNSPLSDMKRIEIFMTARDLEVMSEGSMIISSELCSVSKLPFRENTWLGEGHTVDVSRRFKERFGYHALLFCATQLTAELSGLGTVKLLMAIPIYEEEYNWVVANNSLEYIKQFFSHFGYDSLYVDDKRDLFIPDCEAVESETAELSPELLERFDSFVLQLAREEKELTYDAIGRWLEENLGSN